MGIARDARKSRRSFGARSMMSLFRLLKSLLSMHPHSESPIGVASATGQPVMDSCSGPASAYLSTLLRVLAVNGYGLWMLLGLALALGIYRDGRSEALVPLALGAAFVSAGLLVTCLRLPAMEHWHGWRPGQRSWPTSEALLAMSTYLPMLAVAGLARGDNDFWATRLAGAALLLCSLATLAYAVRGYRNRLADGMQRHLAQLPASRVVSAWYSGGLWLWLCMATQESGAHPAGTRPWIMALLLLALLLGLIEGMRWQSLHGPEARNIEGRARRCRPARYVAAVFTYAIPSVLLLLVDLFDAGALLIGVAAVSCLLGRTIEQRSYEIVLIGPGSPH